jgi:hypothetical protein
MPFKSKAQQRWMFANKPQLAQKWAQHTPSIRRLPKRLVENAALKKAFTREKA